MKFQLSNTASIDNTSLMGTIQATPAQMEKAFGEPEVNHPEDRVPLMWTLVNAEGDPDVAVATIYLWKKPVPNSDQVTTWNIGGHSTEAVTAVHNAFREAHALTARSI